MIEIRRIDAQHKSDINIPNEAFPVFGRIIPSFNNGHWTYKLERYHPENITEITFPNKDYVYEDMEDSVFLNGIPFVPQKFRNFPAILEHRKIQANPL